ncbi:hypothetical protein [Cohnella abietis]|uniref:LXG domain-containing protein n=1 Tax=Cohnella abietis TaxID=2507935 RepID=A0A3T1D4Q4_9BACL|nr:hypothetical protein [Cohnella abietis]BBI33096.1 hypothetical protein KCTCHS21_24950 [Cohnella abietis]
MEMVDRGQFIECLYREVGDMLSRAKQTYLTDSETLQKLDMVYGGVETIKHRFPSSEAWWEQAAAGLEEIRIRLVTMSENRLYTS